MVALLGLTQKVDLFDFIKDFLNAAEVADCGTILTALTASSACPVTFQVNNGQRLSLIIIPPDVPLAALEIIKVADLLLLVVPVSGREETQLSEIVELSASACRNACMSHIDIQSAPTLSETIPILQAQGLPPIICALRGLDALPIKFKTNARKLSRDLVQNIFRIPPDNLKLYPADFKNELCEIFRQVCEHRGSQLQWRSARAYVLTERFTIVPESAPSTLNPMRDGHTVMVHIEGFVRGSKLSANQLVHLPGIGDFPIVQIMSIAVPNNSQCRGGDKQNTDASDDDYFRDAFVYAPDQNHQEIALRENVPDPHSNEQTWPTDEDIASSSQQGINDSCVEREISSYNKDNRFPQHHSGVSLNRCKTHQEDCMVDDKAHGEILSYELQSYLCEREVGGVVKPDRADIECTSTLDSASGENGDVQRKPAYNISYHTPVEDELQFPDEIETPLNTPARKRFARYRGLKSFRSSRWDPKEQLPAEYSRLFGFGNFRRATRKAMTCDKNSIGAGVGDFVRVIVKGIPRMAAMTLFTGKNFDRKVAAQYESHLPGGYIGSGGVGPIWNGWCGGSGPVILSSLLQHESKLTVMHYSIVKSPSYDLPLRSKTPLWFHIGFRRERASPIFSTDGLGDKHKFERFLLPGQRTIATVYGPVTYPPAPVLGLKEEISATGAIARLVFSGGVHKSDTNRIILKRVILTGVPFKTHKSKAVVRHMFFNPDDVRWFQPLELWTKHGLRGKIKEAVGMHGHMKCVFNGVIQQRDTVCVTLYKRVYPKFLVE